jgi:hypothetical protein
MLYRKVGLLQQARTALSVSIELFDSMEMTFWLRQAHALWAEIGERSAT